MLYSKIILMEDFFFFSHWQEPEPTPPQSPDDLKHRENEKTETTK